MAARFLSHRDTLMRRISLADRIRYRFDSEVARGPSVLVVWLIVFALLLVLILAFAVVITHLSPSQDNKVPSVTQQLWTGLLHFLDNGNISNDALAGGWGYVLLMLTITLVGILFSGALTGIITNGLAARLDAMRKGRSFVVETNHTLILGWSSQIMPVIEELVLAHNNGTRACIVILADRDKVEMEDQIHAKLPKTGMVKIVCRTGDPIDLTDLELVNPHAAKSIIVLAPDETSPDSSVISSVLAITNNPNRRTEPYHIVAVIHDEHNLEAAKLVGQEEAEFVLAGQLISKITAQTCRQSGLSVVYSELLSFAGNEIYRLSLSEFWGKTFAETLFAFEQASVIGLIEPNGTVRLNPPSTTVLEGQSQLIVIAQDSTSIRPSSRQALIDPNLIVKAQAPTKTTESTLILGWNRRAMTIIDELDGYVMAGSSVTVVADLEQPNDFNQSNRGIRQQSLRFQRGDPTDRRVLTALNPERYDHVVVLASEALSPKQADAATLVTLLHLRELKSRAKAEFTIVSEMLDPRNRELAEVTQADDFIISERLVSLVVAQLSEDWTRATILKTLFSSLGGELYLKPISSYVKTGIPVSFDTVLEATRSRGELAIGYRLLRYGRDASKNEGVVLNPKKSELIVFAPEDKVIVVAD